MLGFFRSRLSYANVIATLALVFATAGGAFAASNPSGGGKATAATKKAKAKKSKAKSGPAGPRGPQGPAGPTGPTGATGPAGPTGPTGAAGVQGEKGLPGEPGKSGTDGKGVTVGNTASNCAAGGVTVEVEGSGSPHEVCDGAEGPEGPEGNPWSPSSELPVGATESGIWVTTANSSNVGLVPINYPIKLSSSTSFTFVEVTRADSSAGGTMPAGCKGTVAKPEAASGHLCFFVGLSGGTVKVVGSVVHPADEFNEVSGIGTAGSYVRVEGEAAEEVMSGSWAVTG